MNLNLPGISKHLDPESLELRPQENFHLPQDPTLSPQSWECYLDPESKHEILPSLLRRLQSRLWEMGVCLYQAGTLGGETGPNGEIYRAFSNTEWRAGKWIETSTVRMLIYKMLRGEKFGVIKFSSNGGCEDWWFYWI